MKSREREKAKKEAPQVLERGFPPITKVTGFQPIYLSMKTPVFSKEEQDYLNIIDKNFNVNDKYFCYSPYRDVMSYTSFKIGCYPFEDEDILNVLADFVVKDEAEKSREKAMQKLKKMNSDELISIFNETCPYCDRYIGDMEDFDEWLETCIDADLDVSPERCAFLMKYVDEMIK